MAVCRDPPTYLREEACADDCTVGAAACGGDDDCRTAAASGACATDEEESAGAGAAEVAEVTAGVVNPRGCWNYCCSEVAERRVDLHPAAEASTP